MFPYVKTMACSTKVVVSLFCFCKSRASGDLVCVGDSLRRQEGGSEDNEKGLLESRRA